jgi:hypothetical protein
MWHWSKYLADGINGLCYQKFAVSTETMSVFNSEKKLSVGTSGDAGDAFREEGFH